MPFFILSMDQKVLTAFAALWLLSFLAKPGTLSVFLPPLLLLLAWAAVAEMLFAGKVEKKFEFVDHHAVR